MNKANCGPGYTECISAYYVLIGWYW